MTSGILSEECIDLNRYWNKWIATGLPYVVVKAAMTLDGKIASHPESRWLSNERSRREVMKLRARMGAIMVGGETVRIDDPQLTVRGIQVKRQPVRAVWTRSVSSQVRQGFTIARSGCDFSKCFPGPRIAPAGRAGSTQRTP